jgi:hypothetical protein
MSVTTDHKSQAVIFQYEGAYDASEKKGEVLGLQKYKYHKVRIKDIVTSQSLVGF